MPRKQTQAQKLMLEKMMFGDVSEQKQTVHERAASTKLHSSFVARSGGAKGSTGSTDHTSGLKAFVRPCTVGHKSQQQPHKRGGGNRTPL